MPSTSVFNLVAGTSLASADVLPFVDVSDSTQSPQGSLLKITVANFFATVPSPINVTSSSANALAVGRQGTTDPAFQVDASTASSATGLKVKAAAAAGGVAVSVLSSGTNEALTVDAKGSGTITIAGTSTGAIVLTRATTLSAGGTVTTGGFTVTAGGLTVSASGITVTGNSTIAGTLGSLTGITSSGTAALATVTVSATLAVTGATTLAALSATTGAFSSTVSMTTLTATSVGVHTFGSDAGGSAALALNAAAGTIRDLRWRSAGVDRWLIRVNSNAELGADSGSNFELAARTDTGASIDSPIVISRAAGGTMTLARPVSMSSTLAVTGAITASSTVAVTTAVSIGSTPASAGNLRLPNNTNIAWRNNANSANISLSVGTGDLFAFSAGLSVTGVGTFSGLVTASAGLTVASGQTLTVTGATITGAPTWSSTQSLNTSGNAGTATALENARTIGGVSFDGTSNITVASATGGFTVSGGSLALGTNSLTLTGSIASTGSRVTKGWFTDLEVTNAVAGSITGNAATATALATARTIWGQSFDGTANVTAAPTFGAGATVSSGQTLTVTGATITGLTAASVGTGTFPGVYTVTGSLTLSAALVYGGVTLSNAVTGTGNMVLSASPTLTGTTTLATVSAGAATFSGAVTASIGAVTYTGTETVNTGAGPTTLFAIAGDGYYTLWVSDGGATNYMAGFFQIVNSGSTIGHSAVSATAGLAWGLSGGNITITNTTGSNLNLQYRVLRVF